MEFFDREQHVRRQSRLLVLLFGVAVVISVSLLCLVLMSVGLIFRSPLLHGRWWDPIHLVVAFFVALAEAVFQPVEFLKRIWDPQLAMWTACGALVSIAAGCWYKIRLLSRGGAAVAELLGGRSIDGHTADVAERRLRDVVEEMAIASGMPMPQVYVLDRERGINTFAAGYTREDVAIGVTYGCLKLLTRDELQGAIAHEFSHLSNGDTRLNMRLMGLVHGLFWPTIVGRILLRGTSDAPPLGESIFDDEAGQTKVVLVPFACVFLAIGSLSSWLVRWIKRLICREREWLADAEAVQFTRNPAGIEGALTKIGGLLKQGRLDTAHAESASHFYLVSCIHDPWFRFQSTHPPLAKRIQAINPQFDGHFPHIRSLPSRDAEFDRIYEESVQRARAEAELHPEE